MKGIHVYQKIMKSKSLLIKLIICVCGAVLIGMVAHSFLYGVISLIISSYMLLLPIPQEIARDRVTAGIVFWGSPFLLHFVIEFLGFNSPWEIQKKALYFSLMICILMILFAYLLLGSALWSLYAASIVCLIIGIINYFVRIYKDAPFNIYDIYSVKTLGNVMAGGMELKTDERLAVGLLLCCIYWIVLYQLRPAFKKDVSRRGAFSKRILCMFIILGAWGMVFHYGVLEKAGLDTRIWKAPEKNGFWVQFIEGYRVSKVKEPAGYSLEVLEEYISQYQEETNQCAEMPHIIVIMNEAFADMGYLGEVDTDRDVLANFNGLSENVVRGYALSSVYGGNTANSEWEFLTGNSMLFMPKGCVPYQMYVNRSTNSLATLMKSYGYHNVAFHPYFSSGWMRKSAWMHLGFDDIFFIDDFQAEDADFISKKLKDSVNYQNILDYIDANQNGQPLFVFNVTMQNHLGNYEYSEEEWGYSVKLTGENAGKYVYTEGYYTLLYESDKAFAELIHELENREERYVVMMFGDHQAVLDDGYMESLLGKSIDSMTEEEKQDLYTVPFLIWANYDIEEKIYENRVSINFLSGVLLDTIGIPGSRWDEFLNDVREEYPCINGNGLYDAEGNYISYADWHNAESEGVIEIYKYLQYNDVFDSINYLDDFFNRN